VYRAFTPSPGLHPGLPAHDPLVLTWRRGAGGASMALHGWRPAGGAYDGLPADEEEARRRRRERVLVSTASPGEAGPTEDTGFTLDLRRAPTSELRGIPAAEPAPQLT
jgi:uncharacterized protein (DUF2126 family)